MTDTEIQKHKSSLVKKLLFWSLFNKKKMNFDDWCICFSKIIDVSLLLALTLFMARISRFFLFKYEFIMAESIMQSYNLNINFWKTIFAYGASAYLGFRQYKIAMNRKFLEDLAFEYKYNFSNELS